VEELRQRLTEVVADGPDPEAGARLLRFFAAAGDDLPRIVAGETTERLLALFLAQSPALANTLYREPSLVGELARDPFLGREKPEPTFAAELDAALAADADLPRALRRYVAREYLRLGARELGWGAADEVGRELGALASVCLDRAGARAEADLAARHGPPLLEDGRRCRWAVIGMGKLGGEELNFSSDIDVIFLYESDAGAAGTITLHEFFSKHAERVVRALSDLTSDGMCFRVDLRLRPEGTQGPITNSLPAMERYYETWGRPWERQAFIKAKPVAGDLPLGNEALSILEPFVWSRAHAADAIAAVHDLMGRIRAELSDEDDVKLGPGGIREIEFFAQALQLVHGGRNRRLRERGTLRALDKLLFAGLVSEHEHRLLGDAYVFLRRVEHRLQLEELRQTHALPRDREKRALLARRLGYGAVGDLDTILARQRARVSEIYATLGRADEPASDDVATLLDPRSDRDQIVAALTKLGFRDVEASADEVELLRTRPSSPFAASATGGAARAAPILVEELALSPDPDLALRHLTDLSARAGAGAELWELAATHRPLGRLLVSLLGTSDFLAKIFVAHPEMVEPLVLIGRSVAARAMGEHQKRIADRFAALEDPDDDEAKLNALRRYRNEELLRIGLYDVAGELPLAEVSTELTTLAEACLSAALAIVTPPLQRRFGDAVRPLAVLGLGKLGGAEMTYSSDLDVVFVFDGDESAFEPMSRLAQRLIRALDAYMEEGRLYEIDTRLRPSGQRGALVSTLDGFRRYHQREAALWERQALIKARVVAGEPALAAAIEEIAAHHVWEGPPLDAAATAIEVARLRERMERELSQESPERFNIKSGRGGLLDVEFLVQYLQLVHGPRLPSLRARATAPALDALGAAGILAPDDHDKLAASYQFLRRLENRLRIVHDRPIAMLAASLDGGELDKLARRLGYRAGATSPGARLLDDYRSHSSSVRDIYARLLRGA
jgi:glutamate-ammonia-ligase adenylyltransferase